MPCLSCLVMRTLCSSVYSSSLEAGSFRLGSPKYLYLMLLVAISLLIVAPFAKLRILSSSYGYCLMYIWGRKNPHERLHIFGLLPVRAPYLIAMFALISWSIGAPIARYIVSLIVGHFFYFLLEVYSWTTGRQVIKEPACFRALFRNDGEGRNYGDHANRPNDAVREVRADE